MSLLSAEEQDSVCVEGGNALDFAAAYEKAITYEKACAAFRRAHNDRNAERARTGRKGPYGSHFEKAFCDARDRMMMALLDIEGGDAAALVRKVRYMSCAELPVNMDPDDVLYYREGEDKVHLFYGGGLSPTSGGESPDGEGHAHVVLHEVNRTARKRNYERVYEVVYHRTPSAW